MRSNRSILHDYLAGRHTVSSLLSLTLVSSFLFCFCHLLTKHIANKRHWAYYNNTPKFFRESIKTSMLYLVIVGTKFTQPAYRRYLLRACAYLSSKSADRRCCCQLVGQTDGHSAALWRLPHTIYADREMTIVITNPCCKGIRSPGSTSDQSSLISIAAGSCYWDYPWPFSLRWPPPQC